MARIHPFKAIRPTRDKAHLVASRPVYTYTRRILNAKLETNPYTFIHIVQPEFGQKNKTKPNSPERFRKVRAEFEQFLERGWLIQDEKPCLYLYRQISPEGRTFNGIMGGAHVDDYNNGTIKKHEQTLTKREKIFSNYLDIVEFNAEPVLLTCPDDATLEARYARIMESRAEYDFTNTDHIQHSLWVIDNPDDIAAIQQAFDAFENIYIADGHHRSASSALFAKMRKAQNNGGEGPYQHFMTMFIPESQLDIREFNRVVKGLNGMSRDEFLTALGDDFVISRCTEQPKPPQHAREMRMYLDHDWYTLIFKEHTYDPNNPLADLDAQLLTDRILRPVLNIGDLKTDKRIDFIGGLQGMEGLKKAVDSGRFRVAFALCPVAMEQLKHISDIGETMPPKSTWIEPKLRSGLTIMRF